VAVIAFGTLTLLTITTVAGLVVGSALVYVGALFLFFAGYDLWAMKRGERELQARGISWRVPRTLIPIARRDMSLPIARTAALETVLQALQTSDPDFPFLGAKRTRTGVRAYTAAPVMPLSFAKPSLYFPSWWPGGFWQVIQITAEERPGGTDLHVVVKPYTQQLGEDLADDVVEAIRRQLHPPEAGAVLSMGFDR
jgi:hypothetical protein